MKLEQVNPSVKVITVLLSVILLSFQYLVMLNAAVFLVCILLLVCSRTKIKRLFGLLLPAVITALCLFITGFVHNAGADAAQLAQISSMPYALRSAMSTDLYSALQLSTRLLAFAGLGILFTLSTDGEWFIISLIHQCRLPVKFAYGILAAVHLLPTMLREYRAVKLAFRTRGVKVHWYSLQPIFVMLVNSVRWSSAVAMAMESKGFDADAKRTYAAIPKLHWYDFFYAGIWLGGIVAGMALLKY